MSKRIHLLEVPIDPLSREEALSRVRQYIDAGIAHQVATVNPEFLVETQRNRHFLDALKQSELNLADGIGIRAAATFQRLARPDWKPARFIVGCLQWLLLGPAVLLRLPLLSAPIAQTIPGISLVENLLAEANEQHWRVYLLGGAKGVAQELMAILAQKYPDAKFVGANSGPHWSAGEMTKTDLSPLINSLKEAKPDILLVAFGAPKQELFIAQAKRHTSIPLMIGVGGSFDFLTGRVRRAPEALRAIGLEWLWRLILQPWRAKRIWQATILFPWRVLMDDLSRS